MKIGISNNDVITTSKPLILNRDAGVIYSQLFLKSVLIGHAHFKILFTVCFVCLTTPSIRVKIGYWEGKGEEGGGFIQLLKYYIANR